MATPSIFSGFGNIFSDLCGRGFPHPHLFVPNTKSLEVIALQCDVAWYQKLCEHMPALRETLPVYRKASVSGKTEMIKHLLSVEFATTAKCRASFFVRRRYKEGRRTRRR